MKRLGWALVAASLGASLAACTPPPPIVIYGADYRPPAASSSPAPAPYCMVDREVPAYLTVAGPSGGVIAVDGKRVGELVLVDAIDYGPEVAPDAGPFDGILYNVPGPGVVAVDGHPCETT